MIIAHRMRTVADADKIVVLKDGIVAECGTPAELERQDGIYKGMVDTQMLATEWNLQKNEQQQYANPYKQLYTENRQKTSIKLYEIPICENIEKSYNEKRKL